MQFITWPAAPLVASGSYVLIWRGLECYLSLVWCCYTAKLVRWLEALMFWCAEGWSAIYLWSDGKYLYYRSTLTPPVDRHSPVLRWGGVEGLEGRGGRGKGGVLDGIDRRLGDQFCTLCWHQQLEFLCTQIGRIQIKSVIDKLILDLVKSTLKLAKKIKITRKYGQRCFANSQEKGVTVIVLFFRSHTLKFSNIFWKSETYQFTWSLVNIIQNQW